MAAALPARANLLQNGGFEDEPNWGNGVSGNSGYTALTGDQIPGWTIEDGHAVTIHNTTAYPTITGNYSLNLDGEGYNGHNGNLYQDFASTSGLGYEVAFDWETWNDDTSAPMEVSVTDTVSGTVLALFDESTATSGPVHESQSFVGTGNALRLRILENPESGFNDNKYIVDNFEVNPVPEPASLLVVGAGLAMLRRRRAVS